jgi:O-glycosyl hydrolase
MSASGFIFGATAVIVSPGTQYQTTEGWGTSLCWWGNVVGGYSDTNRNAIADLIFNPNIGLGLNIVRYNIGGGDNPSHTHLGVGKNIPGFKPTESGPYDWTKDANQRWMLSAAKSRIASSEFIAEAFSNSPPYWMTNSGCASGASGGGNNLKTGYYDDFADYLTEVVKHFRDSWGITFRTLDPMNEPMEGWGANGGQEGCHFDRSLQPNIIREVKAKLDSKELSGTKISAPDETSIDNTVGSYSSYDSTIRSYIYQINTHIYWGSQRAQLRTLATNDGKKLWDSEADGSGASAPFDVWPHNHNDVVPALDIANRITLDLRQMKVDAWIFWQAIESEQTQTSLNKNWGMIHADFNGGQNYYLTKKYYGVEQYTKFIRPGYKMIDINQSDAVAFMNLSQGRLVIVQRNASTSAITYDYNLSGFSGVGATAAVYRTSSSENFAQKPDIPITNKILSATANAQSITTYVINGIAYGGGSTPTPTPTPTSGSISAFSQIEAESYNTQSGIQTESCGEGGQNIGYIENGDYVVYNNVDFAGGATGFQARVASNTSGGNIEIRFDSVTGPLVGTCAVSGTGGWQTWTTSACSVNSASGTHNLILRFTGGSGYLFNLNWFKFTTGSGNTPTPTVRGNTPTPTPSATPAPTGSYVRFRNVATGLYIDGMGSTSNGSNACQYSSSSSYNQQWTLEAAGGYYKIKNRATGLYLDGMGRTSNGSICGQYSSSSSYNQQWSQETSGSYVRFKNRATGLYLDGMGSAANGSNICQWSRSSSANQQWQIQ